MPDPATLTTRRLILTALRVADADDLFPTFADRDTMRFFGDRHASVMVTRALFDHVITGLEATSSLQWAIRIRLEAIEQNRVIGSISLNAIVGGTARMGFILSKEHHGRGYATEAVGAAVAHGFNDLGLHRITLHIDPENAASRRVAEKLGFRQEGRMRESFPIGDTFRDELVFGLLAREWDGAAPPLRRDGVPSAFIPRDRAPGPSDGVTWRLRPSRR
jgi:ribosomal-protein-alanine N-acetyltransferase